MLLEVVNLMTHFRTEDGIVRAVDGVSFSVGEGKTLGIVGESGCGKSVTALSLLGLLPPAAFHPAGRVSFRGRDLLSLGAEGMREVRGNEIGMIFQEPMTSLNPVYRVGFQVAEAIFAHRPRLTRAQVRERVMEILRQVGFPDPAHHYDDYPHELSGGMRQRIMIAMALACHPGLLIADEPTTALDVTIQAQILDLIHRLRREMGMTVLLITHDLGVVAENVDDVMVMYAGRAVEKAPVGELFRNPLHPYTRGLLASMPSAQDTGPLKGIPGSVPSLIHRPSGCRFQDRCAKAVPACGRAEPSLEPAGPDHWVSCFEVGK